jgi:chloramphenicol O-acetyltransferase type A
MKTQINPQETSRAEAFNLWLSSPMPMVTLTKTFDVTKILKASKKHKISFNALLCWCIGKTASQIEEFYLLVEKEKLYKYDKLAINVIVNNQKGGINSCDIAWSEDLKQFLKDYSHLTTLSIKENKSSFLEDYMIIGTSAMIQTEIDSIVNQYTDKFTNPMLMWGKYRKHFLKTLLPISFQFHHVQMDGGDGARFLELLQKELNLVY